MKSACSKLLLTLSLVVSVITPVGAAATQDPTDGHRLAAITPAEAGVNEAALAALVERAGETHSDSLVILKDGKLVGEWYFNNPRRPIEAMSVTKSIVSIAIGRLVTTGKIKSIDEPVYTFYPQWKAGPNKPITLRHLLNHTSGLQAGRTTEEIYSSPDFVQLALAAELTDEPGAKMFYNNKATNLLAGVVKVASGRRMDEYLKDEIFTPLGIKDFSWTLDKAGNPHGMSGLQIHAVDLAKLGQLMLNNGLWEGNQLLSKEWVTESAKASQPYNKYYGLLWWLEIETKFIIDDEQMAQWRNGGIDAEMIDKVATLKGKQMEPAELEGALITALGGREGFDAWRKEFKEKRVPGRPRAVYESIGYAGKGDLGQYVVVLPASRIVAVRQIRYNNHKTAADSFADFLKRVKALTASN